MTPLPPPGWYPDPRGTNARVYWNGTAWAPPRTNSRNTWAIAGGAIIGVLVVGASLNVISGSGDHNTEPAASPPPPPTSAEPLTPTINTDNWYRIDDCLLCDAAPPGTYESQGAVDPTTPCSWRRNTKPSGDLSYVIMLGKVDPGKGPGRVEVNRGEYFFSQGCYPWKRITS